MSDQKVEVPNFSRWDNKVVASMAAYCAVPGAVLVRQSGILESTSPISLLDNCGGPGTITSMVFKALRPEQLAQTTVVIGDNSPKMLEIANQNARTEGWTNVECQEVDAQNMSTLSDSSLTHVLTNMGPQLIPNAEQAMKEIHRVLKPGGINGFTSWTQTGWSAPLLRVAPLTESPMLKRFQSFWVDEEQITADLTRLGFKDIKFTRNENVVDMRPPEESTASLQKALPMLFTQELAEKTVQSLVDDFGGKEVWKSVIVTAVKA